MTHLEECTAKLQECRLYINRGKLAVNLMDGSAFLQRVHCGTGGVSPPQLLDNGGLRQGGDLECDPFTCRMECVIAYTTCPGFSLIVNINSHS